MAIVFSIMALILRITIWPFLVHCVSFVRNDLQKSKEKREGKVERRKTTMGVPLVGRRKEDREIAYAR